MIVMIDDIQLGKAETFFSYISMALGKGPDTVTDENILYDVLSDSKQEIEIIVHDLDDVAEENRKFAKKIIGTCMDAKLANKKIKINFLSGEENAVKE